MDRSALIPLILPETRSVALTTAFNEDRHPVIWWIAVVECHSALARVIRDKHLVRDDAGRAADALQLAAALAWCKGQPNGETLVCADRRLREAARHEGFDLQPGE